MLAWLTPDTSDFSQAQEVRLMPCPPGLFSFINGALYLLSDERNWEQFGTATPNECAAFFLSVIEDFQMSRQWAIGEISAFVGNVPPRWLLLDGGNVLQSEYPELAAIVPASWLSGGDINLPDMQLRTLAGDNGSYAVGDSGGSPDHTLTVAEMPAHTHTYNEAIFTSVDLAGVETATIDAQVIPANTGSTGNGQAHNNMPPFLAVKWCIYAGW